MTTQPNPRYRIGAWLFDAASGELSHQGRVVGITPKAGELLVTLGKAGGALVPKAELFDRLWSDRDVSDAALTTCVRELREALGDDARRPRYIGTLHRRGYRLLAPWQAEANGTLALDAPIGRERELAALEEALARVRAGRREVVFVSGEAGIGKTTLLDAFVARCAARGGMSIAQGHCVEQHGAGEPYMPLLEAVGRLVDTSRGPRVVELLRRAAPSWLAQLPAAIDGAEHAMLVARATGVTRERMLREWCDVVERLAAEQPLLLAIEDLHWSDASTLDAVNALARRTAAVPLLLVATLRSNAADDGVRRVVALSGDLTLGGCARSIELPLWTCADVERFVATQRPSMAPEARGRLAASLHKRSEGNPLFAVCLIGLDDTGIVPPDLRGVIRRQLARLSATERRVLETAAAVGQRFDAATATAGLADATIDVERICLDLAERRAFIDGSDEFGTDAGFVFRHTLYRERLYAELASGERTALHARIAAHLAARPDDLSEPAQLAHHFERANDHQRAACWHQRAGQVAARRSAPREAVEHAQRALQLLALTPPGADRTQTEVELLIMLGGQLMALRGWGADEVEKAYSRAQALCDQGAAARPALFPALWGLWLFRWGRGDLASTHALCGRLEKLADRSGNAMLQLQAHHASWATCLTRYEYAAAIEHARAAAALGSGIAHTDEGLRYGNHDALVCGDSMAAIALAIVGDSPAAHAASERALDRAQRIQHPFSSTLALYFASMLHQMLDAPERCREMAEAAHAKAVEQGFELFRGWADATAGWAIAAGGDGVAGLARLRSGIATARATGTAQLQPYLATLLADGCCRAGEFEAARQAVAQGLAAMGSNAGGVYRGELLRIDALLDSERRAQRLAEADDIARRLGSRWLHERVARSGRCTD